MIWNTQIPKAIKPDLKQISEFIDSPLWPIFIQFIDENYSLSPTIEYSCCSGAPGWNVKYKKSGRSLCTLYPNKNYFTCLLSIGSREAMEAELLLSSCSVYLQELYKNTRLFNGSRWLMIDVTTPEVIEDLKKLLPVRMAVKK